MFGSATDAPAYDWIASQPVISVGTPWGSPYLLFDRIELGESRIVLDELEDNKDDTTLSPTSTNPPMFATSTVVVVPDCSTIQTLSLSCGAMITSISKFGVHTQSLLFEL